MALAISSSIPIYERYQVIEKRPDSLNKIVGLFRKKISDFLFLMRGVTTFFSWGQVLPLSKELQTLATAVRTNISSAVSILGIPRFFINHFDLYNACVDLWNTTTQAGANLSTTLTKVKNVFVKTIFSAVSSISMIQLLDRYCLIDLGKISIHLLSTLLRGQNLLFLLSSCIGFAESAWSLGDQIRTDLKTGFSAGPSPKLVKCIVRMCGSSLRLTSSALRTAMLFLGISLGPFTPIILVGVTSASFMFDLFSKVLTQSNLIYDNEGAYHPREFSYLPS